MADSKSVAELFVGHEVEVLLRDTSATTMVTGVTFPNEGTLVAYDNNGVVLQKNLKGKPHENLLFFPFETIRLIRRKPAVAASPATPPPVRKAG